MPLRYAAAPVVIRNDGHSDCPAILREIANMKRSTPVLQFSAKFRSRRTPVNNDIALQLIAAYQACRLIPEAISKSYDEALPSAPPLVDRERDRTYQLLIERWEGLPMLSG